MFILHLELESRRTDLPLCYDYCVINISNMKNKTVIQIDKLKAAIKNPLSLTAFVIILILTIIGVHILTSSHAATPYISSYADTGTVVSPGTVNQQCSGSSSGKCVVFGSGSTSDGTYHTSGNQIIGPKGVFQPFGFVVYCLSEITVHAAECGGPLSDSLKIQAAGTFWHANDVRIQVATEGIYPNLGNAIDPVFVAKLDAEVNLANSLGMIAVITQQTERAGTMSFMPDAGSVKFWQYMSQHYANNPKVFFDLFNEPRLNTTEFSGTTADYWNIWQKGGTVNLTAGGTASYVGMQTLIDLVRQNATNIIVIEANHGDKDLSLLSTHLLSGNDLVYGIEPNLYSPISFASGFWLNSANETPAEWDANFGNVSKTHPMMIEAFNDHPSGGCYTNSNVVFPQLLSYLQAHNLGMTFFTLEPGLATMPYPTNPTISALEDPTTYPNSGSTLDCTPAAITANATIGNGQDLLDWYTSNTQNKKQ
jgi:hypothetical protein